MNTKVSLALWYYHTLTIVSILFCLQHKFSIALGLVFSSPQPLRGHKLGSITSTHNLYNTVTNAKKTVSSLFSTSDQHVVPTAVTYGANSFGDIMNGCITDISVEGSFTPLERIVLTANGNLQRILSAYFGAPVTVKVLKSEPIKDKLYDRAVELLVFGKVISSARGTIEIFDESLASMVESGQIGVGQLFRYLNVLPHFKILAAGKRANGTVWREYTLQCDQLTCHFTEEFVPGIFDITSE